MAWHGMAYIRGRLSVVGIYSCYLAVLGRRSVVVDRRRCSMVSTRRRGTKSVHRGREIGVIDRRAGRWAVVQSGNSDGTKRGLYRGVEDGRTNGQVHGELGTWYMTAGGDSVA